MANRVKGIVVEIGGDVTGLDKALSGTNKKISATQSQLRDVERLLKLDPTNTKLLEQKQKLLAQAVADTKDKLDSLNTANEQVSKSHKNYDAWKKAYDPIQEEIATTSKKLSELKERQKEMNDCGEADTDAYRQIQQEVQNTSKQLRDLKAQAKEVSDQFGNPVSPEQFDLLQREIEATRIDLRNLEKKADDVDSAMKGIDEKPIDDVEDAARRAEGALDDAGREASAFADHLKAEMIADAAQNIIGSLRDVAEESKEYRKIMASLDVSSEDAGYTADETAAAYKKLYGVLGDDQTTATTLANLQALGLGQDDLMTMIDSVIGGWARYGDSIPIDGLAEAINHTIQLGEVQGTMADLLEWAGIPADALNRRLAGCATETEKVNAIVALFASQGLTQMGKAWRENNASLVENNEANARMQEQLADLSELVEPVFTRVINAVADALEWFNGLDESTQKMILTAVGLVAALGPVAGAVSGVSGVVKLLSNKDTPGLISIFGTLTDKVLPGIQNTFSSVFGFIAANPFAVLTTAIFALVSFIALSGDEIQGYLQEVDDFLQNVFQRDWTEVFGPGLGDAVNGFMQFFKVIWDSIEIILDGIIDFIRGAFTGNWERAWKGVMKIFEGIVTGIEAIFLAPINAIIGIINGLISGLNYVIETINLSPGEDFNTIGTIGYLGSQYAGSTDSITGTTSGSSAGYRGNNFNSSQFMANGGTAIQGNFIVGEAGAELLTVANGRAIVQPLNQTTNNHSTSLGGVNIAVYAAPEQDAREIAGEVLKELQHVYESEEVSLANGQVLV